MTGKEDGGQEVSGAISGFRMSVLSFTFVAVIIGSLPEFLAELELAMQTWSTSNL